MKKIIHKKQNLKVVILCGGKGTRIVEETAKKPKPMIKIGSKPILIHIMDMFRYYGFNDFILASGYKREIIVKYFKNYKKSKNIKVINTGKETMTGGRILRLKKLLKNEKCFLMTYGDGVCDINLIKLLNFHKKHKKVATVTAVHPPVRFGELKIKKNKVSKFEEKPQAKAGWINGGFFVLSNRIFRYIKNDSTIFEREPLEKLSKENQLMAYKHKSFWQCMDTLRDKILLNNLWNKKKAPWKK
jgi:glucose-1-phosphate cytidylyltransferase